MRLLAVVALLPAFFAGCKAGDGTGGHQHHPARLISESDLDAGQPLDPMSSPVVLVLLHPATQEQTRVLEERMGRLGYSRARGQVLVDAAAELCFFGKPTEVLQTNVGEVAWLASRALWQSEVPFDWAHEMARGLFVPAAYAERARTTLSLDPLTAPRVIDRDGNLVQDRMAAQQADAAGRPQAAGG